MPTVSLSEAPALVAHPPGREEGEAPPRSYAVVGAVLGGWLVLAVLETAKEWIGWRLRGSPRSWGAVAAVNLPFWLYWAAVTPVIIALATRFPLVGGRTRRAVVVHGIASIGAAVGHAAVTAGFAVLFLAPGGQLQDPSFLAQFRPLAEGYLLLEIFVYWMILGVTQTVVFHRRFVAARIGRAEAEARAARSESRAAEARLQALRMEIDPHFLFNAMNAVSGLVRSGDARGATDMLARIGGLLRVTLRYGREGSVSLQREIELVREYLGIESVRFGERLEVEIDVAEEVLDVAVPPLILQPLVENAIRHGVAPVPGPASVRIRAYLDAGSVRIDVLDSGPGPDASARPGTGLSNVSARVQEEYRGAGSFEIVTDPGGGGRATLRLPRTHPGLVPASPGVDA